MLAGGRGGYSWQLLLVARLGCLQTTSCYCNFSSLYNLHHNHLANWFNVLFKSFKKFKQNKHTQIDSELHIVWILLLEEPLVEGVGPVLLELGPVQEVLEGEARAEAEQDPERSVAGHVVTNLGGLCPPVTFDLDGFIVKL